MNDSDDLICQCCGTRYRFDTVGRTQKSRVVCNNCRNKIARHKLKLYAIEYLGGACARCGITDHRVLGFHHKNPEEKLFGLSDSFGKAWETIVDEVEKCELLCANCHTIEHSHRGMVADYIMRLSQ